jgi:hypothetical protein
VHAQIKNERQIAQYPNTFIVHCMDKLRNEKQIAQYPDTFTVHGKLRNEKQIV